MLAPPFTSNATLLRDDKNPQRSINLAQAYPAVGHFAGCTATYIGGNKAITAAHCIDGSVVGSAFTIGPSANQPIHRRTIISVAKNPAYRGKKSAHDIAIITLDEPLPVAPHFLNGSRKIGKTGTIVGFGDTGNGLSRRHKNGREIKRAVKNKIDVLVPSNFRPEKDDRNAIYIDFDSPDRDANTLKDEFGFSSSSNPKSLEGDAGPGDSGGPLLVGRGIVGITSAGFNDIGTDAQYGTIGIFAPLLNRQNIAWLASQGITVHGRGSTKASSQSSSRNRSSNSSNRHSHGFEAFYVDPGAIESTVFSGLPMANAVQSGGLRAASLGTRDANSRLTRLRARKRTNQAIFSGTHSQASSKLSQFLAFAFEQNIDAAEALGLDDDVELPSSDIFMPGGAFGFAAAGAAVPGKDSVQIVDDEQRLWEIYANGNVGVYDQDPLGDSFGFKSEAGSGAIGIEMHPDDRFSIGATWSYVSGETDVLSVGDYDTDGWAVAAYASYYNNGLWGDLLYSYGNFDLNTQRFLGANVASGETESNTHQIELNLGYNIETRNIVHGPTFGMTYLSAETDSFAESGAGAENLIYDATNADSLTTMLGWQATMTREMGKGLLTTQLRAGWGHEHLDDAETTTVTLQQSPFLFSDGSDGGGFGATSSAERPGSDYMILGVGIDYATGEQFFIGVDYQTRLFWDNASEHFGSIRAGYRF